MALAVHCQLNPQVAPKLAYRRGKREGGEEPVSKHQIRSGDGRWEERRGVGWLNPRRETKTKGRNGDREKEMKEEVTDRRKFLARKRRRRGRAERRLLRQRERRNRAHARGREITVATHNVRTMAVDGKHGVGRALDVLSVYDRLGCDVIGLQETRRSGHSAFSQAGYVVYCSGECGDENGGKKGQGGVGLAVRTSITRAARPPEFISDRLLKVTLELRGRAKAVTFFVAYAPTEIHDASKKHAFWTTLDRAVKDVPRHEQLFVLMDANARTGRREKGGVGSKDNKILGAYGRDILNDNGELLLSFANNHDLAILRKLVRNVTVHPQPGSQLRRAVRKACNWHEESAKCSSRSFLRTPRLRTPRRVGEAVAHGRPAWILPEHQIGAAGGDEEGRITVRP